MDALTGRGAVVMGVVTIALSCSSSVRTPRTGKHPPNVDAFVVETPPPPARIERVPPDPGKPCIWMDGQWLHVRGGWEWSPGMWVTQRSDCYYAPPLDVWAAGADTGNLVHTPGRWYSERDSSVCPNPQPCATPKRPE